MQYWRINFRGYLSVNGKHKNLFRNYPFFLQFSIEEIFFEFPQFFQNYKLFFKIFFVAFLLV
ncbi:MAG: hypothetical protein COZ85_02625 [Candidatus Moranbacteria bacterium CG_4_8_14_3_um_filter_34_16]|nr:MAG: hypothetical protein COT31_03725 [Candidatus Moranbacteria bacterium CG08_land_8_20_14_0_20_34_16]PIW94933.1 MAG: hypothetical protein COZ85_02625 [Candidatus Moranbacteria bacterium CG_4_8_14_3_um_filter_34_16]